MRKQDLQTGVVYAYKKTYYGVQPIRITRIVDGDRTTAGFIEIDVLTEPRISALEKQTRLLESARQIISTWEDYEAALADQRDRAFKASEVKRLGAEEAEKARLELVSLIPDGVDVPDQVLHAPRWISRDDGAQIVCWDVRQILALVKAARKQALDEYDGTGGR